MTIHGLEPGSSDLETMPCLSLRERSHMTSAAEGEGFLKC